MILSNAAKDKSDFILYGLLEYVRGNNCNFQL